MRALVRSLLVVMAVSPSVAFADEADRHFQTGIELYKQKKSAEAIAELELAYKLTPNPRFLYALGQAERQRGDCKAAAAYFQRFLETNPPAKVAEAARINTVRCVAAPTPAPEKTVVAAAPAASPEPVAVTPAALPPSQPAPASPPRRSRTGAYVGIGVAIAGAAVLAGGAVMLAQAADLNNQLSHPAIGTVYDHKQLESRDTAQAAGLGLTIGGGALLVAGVVTAAVLFRQPKETKHAWLLSPLFGAGKLGLVGELRF